MATTKKAGSSPVQAAALPAAVVLRLPTAASEPVQQHGRRGRHPKPIVSLWRERMKRSPLVAAAELRAQLDYVRRARQESYEQFSRDHDALDAIKKRIEAVSAVSADLARRDDELMEALRAVGSPAPTYRAHLGLTNGGAA